MMVDLKMRVEDAEPILRTAAFDAARYSAFCDYITPRTYNPPAAHSGRSLADQKKIWRDRFLKAKRMVEAFGVEYEMTTEQEAMTVHIPMKNEKRTLVKVGGMAFNRLSGGEPDFKNPRPAYRGAIHQEACNQAADRTVRRWRAGLECR